MYGHLDKQPPMTDTWEAGLHPYKAVLKNGKVCGPLSDLFTLLSSLRSLVSSMAAVVPMTATPFVLRLSRLRRCRSRVLFQHSDAISIR